MWKIIHWIDCLLHIGLVKWIFLMCINQDTIIIQQTLNFTAVQEIQQTANNGNIRTSAWGISTKTTSLSAWMVVCRAESKRRIPLCSFLSPTWAPWVTNSWLALFRNSHTRGCAWDVWLQSTEEKKQCTK